tara:strand:- start:168 stop:998 length:831 start_codon:yes stop_codon:yes gene_type:complete
MVLAIVIFVIGKLFGSSGANPFGFALLAFVFILWRPQRLSQTAFAYLIGVLLFVLPAFNQNRFFLDYFGSDSFRYDCFENSVCLIVALAIPFILRFSFSQQLVRDGETFVDDGASKVNRLSIRELLFLTFCFAILAICSRSISTRFTGGFSDSEKYMQWMRIVTPPLLILCLGASATTALCFLFFPASKPRKIIFCLGIVTIAVSTPVLVVIATGRYDMLNSNTFGFSRFWMGMCFGSAIQVAIAIAFSTVHFLLGFRLVRCNPEPDGSPGTNPLN